MDHANKIPIPEEIQFRAGGHINRTALSERLNGDGANDAVLLFLPQRVN